MIMEKSLNSCLTLIPNSLILQLNCYLKNTTKDSRITIALLDINPRPKLLFEKKRKFPMSVVGELIGYQVPLGNNPVRVNIIVFY